MCSATWSHPYLGDEPCARLDWGIAQHLAPIQSVPPAGRGVCSCLGSSPSLLRADCSANEFPRVQSQREASSPSELDGLRPDQTRELPSGGAQRGLVICILWEFGFCTAGC